tara:strand:+ start:2813 stop:2980 length:168 start_codon:yes stop_codon:yes gene_type:complete
MLPALATDFIFADALPCRLAGWMKPGARNFVCDIDRRPSVASFVAAEKGVNRNDL